MRRLWSWIPNLFRFYQGRRRRSKVGYKTLGEKTGKNPKSLMRMLSPSGNPTVENLFNVIAQLKEQEGLEFDIRVRRD